MQARSWDVFCRVVDNYGDAAVCWRLARQLALEHGLSVRLWIDDVAVLRALDPQAGLEGVQVRRWEEAEAVEAAEVVIEAFGCKLPDAYVQAMARASSLWIVLEYLSAEPWVGAHHGLPSPHPQLPLQRFYFFPGFDAASGGLLRERDLLERRDALQGDAALRAQAWRALGCEPPAPGTLAVSLFGYENAAVHGLLDGWMKGPEPVLALVPASRLRPQVESFFGVGRMVDGHSLRRGKLETQFLPFMPQRNYDELLWLCDWNFVRGEDSFVRSQWAGRPMAWQIYEQQQGAHWKKLDAFLDHYCAGLDADAATALRALWHAWNGRDGVSISHAWRGLDASLKSLAHHAHAWASGLAASGDLAANLVQFCRGKVQ